MFSGPAYGSVEVAIGLFSPDLELHPALLGLSVVQQNPGGRGPGHCFDHQEIRTVANLLSLMQSICA